MSLASAIRHEVRYSIGATPTILRKRLKKADRERAASRAISSTVQGLAGSRCRPRITSARRGSASPRAIPGDAIPESAAVDRTASTSRTSRSRARIISRAGLAPRASSVIRRTSMESRMSPRTCRNCGRSETRRSLSGEPKTKWPISNRTSAGPCGFPWRVSVSRTVIVHCLPSSGAAARLDMVKPQDAGIRAKSPCSRVTAGPPLTDSRALPSSTTQ